jgi:hypothetical protein
MAELSVEADIQANEYRLDFYGFADFAFLFDIGSDQTGPSSFSVGNVNLYAQAELGEGWRSLVEVRYMYLPHGSTPFLTDFSQPPPPRTDTTVPDYSDLGHPIRWGGLSIQRAWLERQFHPLFTVRGGHFLTPYGIWNVDHGSPVIIGVRRPFVIGEGLLPQSQTGLEAYGHLGIGPAELGYHLTLSNGRGPIDTHQDLDNNKAIGGRLFGKLDTSAGTFTLGTSGYRGQYTDSTVSFVLADGEVTTATDVTARYDEFSLGADFKWEWDGALVQAEAIFNDVAYDDAQRPVALSIDGGPQGFAPDFRRHGFYGLVGYRTSFVGLMPFAGVEYFDPGLRTGMPPITVYWLGLNMRPTPRVVLKLEYAYVSVSEVDGLPTFENPKFLETQAAWSF